MELENQRTRFSSKINFIFKINKNYIFKKQIVIYLNLLRCSSSRWHFTGWNWLTAGLDEETSVSTSR
jgi:hypothetical protein